MSETNEKVITKRLKSVKRGAYWFGMVGRISIFIGLVFLLFIVLPIVVAIFSSNRASFTPVDLKMIVRLLILSVQALIYGWLFLLGRDAFDAIAYLIGERKDTV